MRSQRDGMVPKLILDLDDADGGLCNAEYLELTSASDLSSTPALHETNRGGEDGMVVP